MKRLTLTALILILTIPCLNAQKKEIAQARSYIKSGKNLDKAEQLMTDLLKKPENRQNEKIFLTAYQAVQAQYDELNQKLYLKQKYDTVSLFDNTRRMFLLLESFDSIDAKPNRKGVIKPKYRAKHSALLDSYRNNLYAGGNYFVRHGDYKKALTYYRLYFDCLRQPLFSDMKYSVKDKSVPSVAYWATYAGYKMKEPSATIEYAQIALTDSTNADKVLQYLTEAYQQSGDTVNYVKTLERGFCRYPLYPFFFARLIDYYNMNNRTDSVLSLTGRAMAINDTLTLFRFARSTAFLNAGLYDEAIAMADSIIAGNDSLADAYFNVATAYIDKAAALGNATSRKKHAQIIALYRKALPYMERYRALAPDMKEKWSPALYLLYLNLNMGKQFDEIDRLINGK
jgi:hypothetical protein